MLAQEFTVAVEARVQEKVAAFLALKAALVRYQRSPDLTTKDRAKGLYQRQIGLEAELKDVLQRIDNIKRGAFTLSDVTKISSFAIDMQNQISDVNSLAEQAGPLETAKGPAFMLGAIALGLGIAYTMRRR